MPCNTKFCLERIPLEWIKVFLRYQKLQLPRMIKVHDLVYSVRNVEGSEFFSAYTNVINHQICLAAMNAGCILLKFILS